MKRIIALTSIAFAALTLSNCACCGTKSPSSGCCATKSAATCTMPCCAKKS